MVSIIDKIKGLREKNNYSQEYIGSKLKISQQAYQKIENGITEIKLELLIKLAHLYNISPHELIGNADSEIQEIFNKKNLEIENLKNENEKLKNYISILQHEILKLKEHPINIDADNAIH